MGIGIEREDTMDHGIISKVPECPMCCDIYLLIFVTPWGIMNEFDTRTSRGIGRRGSGKSTGTDTIIGMKHVMSTIVGDGKTTTAGLIINTRYEMPAMVESGKTTRANMKGERNTSAKARALG
jgi:hypothetical protein